MAFYPKTIIHGLTACNLLPRRAACRGCFLVKKGWCGGSVPWMFQLMLSSKHWSPLLTLKHFQDISNYGGFSRSYLNYWSIFEGHVGVSGHELHPANYRENDVQHHQRQSKFELFPTFLWQPHWCSRFRSWWNMVNEHHRESLWYEVLLKLLNIMRMSLNSGRSRLPSGTLT